MVSWLGRAIAAREPFALGELRAEPAGAGWSLHPGNIRPGTTPIEAAELEEYVRSDSAGRYRPLSGSRNLRRGWQVTTADDGALTAAIEAIYPLATRHIEMAAAGTLRTVPIRDVLKRQSGRYSAAAELSDEGQALAEQVVCGACVRTPVWRDGVRSPAGEVPCPEACSVLVSFCREAQRWEAAPPPPAPVKSSVGFADFETAGNELREEYLARRRE